MEAMWTVNFAIGWCSTANALALVGGGITAVIVHVAALVLALLISIMVLNAVFNSITSALVKHWEKTGHRPSARWAQVISKDQEKGNR